MGFHPLQAVVQVIAQGGLIIGGADLGVHFVLNLIQMGAGFAQDLQLNIHKGVQVLVLLLRVLCHQLAQGRTLNILSGNGPLAVHLAYIQQFGNPQTGLFYPSHIQCLVEHIGLGKGLVKHLDDLVSVFIDNFMLALFQCFHTDNLPYSLP